jgi:hypothetical protein
MTAAASLQTEHRLHRTGWAERPISRTVLQKEDDRVLGIEADTIETLANVFEKVFLLLVRSAFQ